MKFCKSLQRVADLSNPEWVLFWIDYKKLKKLIKRIGDRSEGEGNHDKVSPSSASTMSTTFTTGRQPQRGRPAGETSNVSTNESAEDRGSQSATRSTTTNTTVGCSASMSSPEDDSRDKRQRNIDSIRKHPGEIEFFKLLHSEFQKAVHFVDRAIDEFSIREERIREGMDIIQTKSHKSPVWNAFAKSVYRLYTDLLLLETFCIMTYCSFSKILKKHDKHTGYETRNAFMLNVVNNANFTNYTNLQGMIERCQQVFTEVSDQLAQQGQEGLYEDERLFIDMIHKLNRPEDTSESQSKRRN